VTSSVTWPLDSPYPISYPSSIVTKSLSPALFEILGPNDNWVTTLTFLGHVTSSVTWPLDSQYPISYSSFIVTKPLSTAVFEILGFKDNWVTTLTFLGHVTSSIMWPIDSSYAICYWLSIDTEALSLNVFEIFNPKVPCGHAHSQTHAASDFIFCPMQCALHWTDKNVKKFQGEFFWLTQGHACTCACRSVMNLRAVE